METVVTAKLTVKQVNIVLEELNSGRNWHYERSNNKELPAKERSDSRRRVVEIDDIINEIEG